MPDFDPALFQENERTAPAEDGRNFAQIGSLCGIPEVTIAYETWGELNAGRSNAILIQHALSGDSHAVGWWERLIGPGKPIDTDRFFVIGHNVLGGCQGSTGPAALAPDGKPFGSRFPKVTIEDMVDAQERLVEHLGIKVPLMVAGGSMGGHLCLEWVRRNRVSKAFITAGCLAHSAFQIGFNEAARQAIMRDPDWRNGDYYDFGPPSHGLSVARMIGHISYLSDASFERKFGRERQAGEDRFQVESYLNYQGDKFTNRFDANSLLVLSRAIDEYECTSLKGSASEVLSISFTSDTLYTPVQGRAIHDLAQASGLNSRFELIDLPYGHDSFLLDGELQAVPLREFLG